MSKFKEADMAPPAIAWLEERGFTVHQEVRMYAGGKRADIVGISGKTTIVIEMKTTLTFAVVDQAEWWKREANAVYIMIPETKSGRSLSAFEFCRFRGIGVLLLRRPGKTYSFLDTKVIAKVSRRLGNTVPNLVRFLEKHDASIGSAGKAGGEFYSEFQETCKSLAGIVKMQPGISLRDAIAEIPHHYKTDATARSCLSKWIQQGSVRGVRAERGKCLTLYPTSNEPAGGNHANKT